MVTSVPLPVDFSDYVIKPPHPPTPQKKNKKTKQTSLLGLEQK